MLALPTESLAYTKCNVCFYTRIFVGFTTLMGDQDYLQPMFVSSTYRTTGLHSSYRDATFSVASVCKLFLENYWVTLHLWVSNLKCNLCLLALPTGLLGHTKVFSALSYVQAYGCTSSSSAYFCKLYLLKNWSPLNLWMRQLKSSLGF